MNPHFQLCDEWVRRAKTKVARGLITEKIEMLYKPEQITPPETAELIEALLTATDARRVLEIGFHTGFGALHILRAIIGKTNAHLTSVDCDPKHDRAFFGSPDFAPVFSLIEGRTPECLSQLPRASFDCVFIDSDHSKEHTEAELNAIAPAMRPDALFLFHDIPSAMGPNDTRVPPARAWVDGLVATGYLRGLAVPTAEQADCVRMWGRGYPRQCSPHLGIFTKT